MEFLDISRVSEAITAKRMKIDRIVSEGIVPIKCSFQRCIGYVDIIGRSPAMGRQTIAVWGKHAIFEQNVPISHARWH